MKILGQRLLNGAERKWLWHGYLAAGKITLLTSQWKSGKTTLISVLLARMAKGGQLAELPVAAARAAVISEEGPDNWVERCHKLQIGDHVCLLCRPFPGPPTFSDWRTMIDGMLALHRGEGLDLVVIDPLAMFLPGGSENQAGSMMDCLLALGDLTAEGLAVLLVHHPRKGPNLPGQASRGTGALPSHADILIEMNWYGRPEDDDRRRWLHAYSRHQETRKHLIIELTEAGDDYRVHTAPPTGESIETWQVLRAVLQDADQPLTQREILREWPEDFAKPNVGTISRGLKRGQQQGLIRQRGAGSKREPFRYWLPEREAELFGGTKTDAPGQTGQPGQRKNEGPAEPPTATAIPQSAPAATAPSPGSQTASTQPARTETPVVSAPPAAASRPAPTAEEVERRRLRRWPHG
jgi:AAA domain